MSYDKDDPKHFDISADASDDTGLVGLVAAGPDLGCVHFQSKKDRASQAVFASVLGTGKTTVQHWEQGVKTPSGMACRLLDLVDRKGLSVFA